MKINIITKRILNFILLFLITIFASLNFVSNVKSDIKFNLLTVLLLLIEINIIIVYVRISLNIFSEIKNKVVLFLFAILFLMRNKC